MCYICQFYKYQVGFKMKNSDTNEGRPIPKKLPSGFSFDFKACCYAISQREFKDHKDMSKNRNFDNEKL